MTSDALMEWGKILEGDMKTAAWQRGIKSFRTSHEIFIYKVFFYQMIGIF